MDLKSMLLNPYAALGFALVLVIGGSDFAQRVMFSAGQDVSAPRLENNTAQSLHLPLLTAEEKRDLLAQYNKYDREARKQEQQASEPSERSQDHRPDQAEIDAQQGDVLSLVTENSRLFLRGVIKDGGSYALVEQQGHNGQHRNFIRLKLGDDFEGFQVTRLNLTSMTLQRGAQQVELLMYKRK